MNQCIDGNCPGCRASDRIESGELLSEDEMNTLTRQIAENSGKYYPTHGNGPKTDLKIKAV
jgi:hypothetical protein